jgi:glycosyltransferase involved in cell wall biosynthesis
MIAPTVASPRTVADPSRVLHGRDILCFSGDWSGDPLSKTHLMRILARDNRILWVNSIGYRAPTASKADVGRAFKKLAAAVHPLREVEPNLHVLNPLAVPLHHKPAVRAFNRLWLKQQVRWAMRKLGFQQPINWIFYPAAAIMAGAFNEDLLIYYCVDEYSAFTGVSAQALQEMEMQLISRSDLVVVISDLLYQSKVRFNPRTALVRHGVDFSHFRQALDPALARPADIANLPKPVIGFFGLIADWVDVELMAQVAKHFAHGSLVVLGKATTDVSALAALPNVHLLGRKPYAELPAYCKGFDVALMPFRINELTLNSNPLKVREYLAAGLPVVSTPIPEVEVLGQCRIAGTPEDFIHEVEQALRDPGPRVARSEAIRHESWEARVNEVRQQVAALRAPQPVLSVRS